MAVKKHTGSSAFGNVKGVCPCNEDVTPNPGRVDGLEVGGSEVEPEGWGTGRGEGGAQSVPSSGRPGMSALGAGLEKNPQFSPGGDKHSLLPSCVNDPAQPPQAACLPRFRPGGTFPGLSPLVVQGAQENQEVKLGENKKVRGACWVLR